MWNEEQIKKFERALQGPSPRWDANWEITQQLLKLVTVQSQEIINLRARLDVLEETNTATVETLLSALRQSMTVRPTSAELTTVQIQDAVNQLNKSTEAIAQGQKVAQYAGNVLRFVAKILL